MASFFSFKMMQKFISLNANYSQYVTGTTYESSEVTVKAGLDSCVDVANTV